MKYLFTLLIFASSFLTVSAQKKINFDFDYAQFAYDSTSNYVEFYYSFDQRDLTVQSKDTLNFTAARIRVIVLDSLNNNPIVQKEYRVANIVGQSIDPENKLLVSKIGFIIPKGHYVVSMFGRDDIDSTKSKYILEKFSVKPFMTGDLAVSNIELAKNIKTENVNKESIFYKNTIEIIPNPTILYSSTAPILYYYAEMYNINLGDTTAALQLDRILFNSKGRELNRKIKQINRKNSSQVEVGLINMIKYPTDNYNLVLSLADTANKRIIYSNKKFFYYNPNYIDTTKTDVANYSYLSSEFGVYSEEECDDIFDKSKYIATEREIEQYKKLDSLNSKRDFLFRYWRSRDLEPETEKFEFKDQYFARVEKSNSKYGTFNRPGYKTDRGRVYLMYGEPDQVDMYPNETNMKPYEIWYYNSIEGGVTFIFGDLTGYNDYELLSSTKRGEIRDDTWQRRIITN